MNSSKDLGIGLFCPAKNNQKTNSCFMLDLDEICEICELHRFKMLKMLKIQILKMLMKYYKHPYK